MITSVFITGDCPTQVIGLPHFCGPETQVIAWVKQSPATTKQLVEYPSFVDIHVAAAYLDSHNSVLVVLTLIDHLFQLLGV